MNLGQYLTQYSPLPSGTVAEHLAAIAGRIGTGQTIFCSQHNVLVRQPEIVITRRAKRQAMPAQAETATRPADKSPNGINVYRSEPCLSVFGSGPDEINVAQRTVSVVIKHGADSKTITKGRA